MCKVYKENTELSERFFIFHRLTRTMNFVTNEKIVSSCMAKMECAGDKYNKVQAR